MCYFVCNFFVQCSCTMELVRELVLKALLALPNDILVKVVKVMDCLIQDCGVETVGDLLLLQENDLHATLKPVQIRKLL